MRAIVLRPCFAHPECRGALQCTRGERRRAWRARVGLWLMLLGAFGLGYFGRALTEPAPRVPHSAGVMSTK